MDFRGTLLEVTAVVVQVDYYLILLGIDNCVNFISVVGENVTISNRYTILDT